MSYMADTAHRVQTVVQNVSDENTAVAIATDWLRDELPALDIAQVNASVGTGETTVEFIFRLTDEHVDRVRESNFTYLGEVN